MVGDGQWVTVLAIAELEFALEVGAPQIIGKRALRQRRAARAVARPAAALDQAVAIEHRMNGALGGNPDVAVEPTHQQFADLAGAPVRLLALQPGRSGSRAAAGAGWRSGPAAWSGRSTPPARTPCSGRKSCSRSCGRCRTPGTPRSWLPHPEAGRQSAGALPLPNSLSTASTPPAEQKRKV